MTARTATRQRAPVLPTEHPHVTTAADMMGGQPCVAGQRIPVLFIFDWWETGASIDEIISGYPTLTRAQVHDAISYGYDHPDEIAYWREQQSLRATLRDTGWLYVDGRLVSPLMLERIELPPDAQIYTWETLPPEYDE